MSASQDANGRPAAGAGGDEPGGVDADSVAEPVDARVELDAGVVLGLVLIVLLCIPVSMALLRSGLVGRRGFGSWSKRP